MKESKIQQLRTTLQDGRFWIDVFECPYYFNGRVQYFVFVKTRRDSNVPIVLLRE